MNKPAGYDETQVGGDFTPINVGGHHATIVSVKEQKSSTGKNMLVVAIDFAGNDKQPGYFKEQFNNDTRADKKWPYQAVQYIVTEDEANKCSRSFKSFITSYEKSNNCNVNWVEKFCEQFKNKKIGVVYGEVEEEYNGEVKTRRRIRWFCEDDKVETQNVPAIKTLPNKPVATGEASGFMPIADAIDEEIPF